MKNCIKNCINDVIGKNDVIIRPEKPEDERAVEEMVRESFWNVYRPGALEHYVLHCLRKEPDFIHELNFVMEQDGRIIGQNVFVKAYIKADDGRDIPVCAMGPICIANDLKRQGYGKLLLDFTLEEACRYGAKALCIEGNIEFYGKSDFRLASEFGLRYHGMPEGVEADFFLCRELEEGYLKGVSGEYAAPECYYVDEDKAEEFDRGFAPMVKLKLPSQIG